LLISNLTLATVDVSFLSTTRLSLLTDTLILQNLPWYFRSHISSLLDFSSDQQTRKAFLSFYFLYICLSAKQFISDQNKVLWALSFFRSDHVSKWSKEIFCKKSTIDTFSIITWSEFKQLFLEYLFPINAATEAINKLKRTTYYQRSCIIEDYLNKFQSFIIRSQLYKSPHYSCQVLS